MFEFSEAKEPPRRKRPKGLVWNVLTILVLLTTVCVVTVFFLIYIDPNSNLNPFPPPTFNPAFATATFTVIPRFTLVPSWTPTNALIQVADTPESTFTPVVTTSIIENPTVVAPDVAGTTDEFVFMVQQGSPSAIDGAQFHPDTGCKWLGVAGQATSLNGEAVRGLFVQLGGTLPGVDSADYLTMTGLAPQYGPGGFEITLSDKLVASNGTLWLQLLDQQNLPLSDQIYFNTYDDCQKNLIIIYFDQVR
jgi:heme/copper-type cytochrome/quinol oxidase subunit 2